MNLPRLVIAGTHSGCGTSTAALGLLRALAGRGLRAQPFKAGPDFLDALVLSSAAGRPCRNLDSWLLPHATVLELLARGGGDGRAPAVIEGMMGLYDGRGAGDEGSTAEVARVVAAPVALVIDVAAGSARSAAATALGFSAFDPQLAVAGVIANRVADADHVERLREALGASGIALLGAIPVSTPDALPGAAASGLDVDALLRAARTAPPLVVSGPASFPPFPPPPSARLGIARDEAFAFYYQDALEMLEACGARLVPFSPLRDAALPDVDGLYLGGGLRAPHLHAVSANASMREAVASAIRGGMPVYAEGGGTLYLMRSAREAGGRPQAMVGAIAADGITQARPRSPGYVTLEAEADTLLLRRGETVRGHEVQRMTVQHAQGVELACRSVGGGGIEDGRDGVATPTLVATAAHLHFAAFPELARRLVLACRRYAGVEH